MSSLAKQHQQHARRVPLPLPVSARPLRKAQHVQAVSKSLSLPAGADEQSINFTLAQLIMVMERLDSQIGAAVIDVTTGQVSAPNCHSTSLPQYAFCVESLGCCMGFWVDHLTPWGTHLLLL